MKWLLLLWPSLLFSQVEPVVAPVLQDLNNNIITDIKSDKVSPLTFKDIETSMNLQVQMEEVIENHPCLTEKEKKKKREVLKTKSISNEEFEVVFLASASDYEAPEQEDIEFVDSDDISTDVLKSLEEAKNEGEFYNILEEKIKEYNVNELSLKEQAKFAARLSSVIFYDPSDKEFHLKTAQYKSNANKTIEINESNYGAISGEMHAAYNELMKHINPNLEAFTMSYAGEDSQHIVSMIVDPENPKKMIMNTYNQVQLKKVDGVASITTQNDVGERVRFYQHEGDRKNHVGTFRNDIGSLLYDLATNKDVFQDALLDDRNQQVSKIQLSWKRTVTKTKSIVEGDEIVEEKSKTFKVNDQLIFFRGKTSRGNEMIGILAKKQRTRNVDQYGELKPGEKFGTISAASVNASQTDYKSFGNEARPDGNFFRVYFLAQHKVIKRIIEKDGFVFDGYLSGQIEASAISDEDVNITTDGDATFQTGFVLKKDFENSSLNLGGAVELKPGHTSRINIFDIEESDRQLKATTSAIRGNASFTQNFNNGSSLETRVQKIATAAGGNFSSSIEYTGPRSGKIRFAYSTPTGGLNANKTNLLPRNYEFISAGYTSPTINLTRKDRRIRMNGKNTLLNLNLNLEQGQNTYIYGGFGIRFGN